MGTRNLFTIIHDGKIKLAKYNQWDGYLDGQGKDLAEFIENDLVSIENLILNLNRVKLLSAENDAELIDSIYNIMNSKSDEYKKLDYPLITRDTNIRDQLQAINIGVFELPTVDNSSFKNDGLFCEYAYELNLDDFTIKVFESRKNAKGDYFCDKLVLNCDILQYPELLDIEIKNREAQNAE
jgi:hypothetical protein